MHLCGGSGFFSTGPQSPLWCGSLEAMFQEGEREAASSKAELRLHNICSSAFCQSAKPKAIADSRDGKNRLHQ